MQQRNISLSLVRKAITTTRSDTEGHATHQYKETEIKHWLVLNVKVIDDEVPTEMIEQASVQPAEYVPNPLDGAFE